MKPRSPDMERSIEAMCNASQGVKNEGRAEGIELLGKAVKAAKENHLTTVEQIITAGFDRDVAEIAISIL